MSNDKPAEKRTRIEEWAHPPLSDKIVTSNIDTIALTPSPDSILKPDGQHSEGKKK